MNKTCPTNIKGCCDKCHPHKGFKSTVSLLTAVQEIFNFNTNSTKADTKVSKISKGTNIMKKVFGTQIVESFKFRTCVDPKIMEESSETEIIYESLTAQGTFQNLYRGFHFCFIKMSEGGRLLRQVLKSLQVCKIRRRSSMCKHC